MFLILVGGVGRIGKELLMTETINKKSLESIYDISLVLLAHAYI